MTGEGDSRGAQPAIGAAAKAAFLSALREGARREDAAVSAGFTIAGFYGARRRDPAFAAEWTAALAATPASERPRRAHVGEGGEVRIVPNNRRGLQRRRMRHVRFDEARRAAFLAAFAWSCDAAAAAAEAGVSESTVYLHRRTDAAFAEEFQVALDQGYARLEAEAVRQRLAAQDRLRAAVEESAAAPLPPADMAAEFERVLRLLDRWDRRNRRPERHSAPGSRRQAWSFDSAVELLDRHLRSLGVEIPLLPPEIAARYDPPEPEGAR